MTEPLNNNRGIAIDNNQDQALPTPMPNLNPIPTNPNHSTDHAMGTLPMPMHNVPLNARNVNGNVNAMPPLPMALRGANGTNANTAIPAATDNVTTELPLEATTTNNNPNANANNNNTPLQPPIEVLFQTRLVSINSDINRGVDPLAIDVSHPDEEDALERMNAMLVNATIASSSAPSTAVSALMVRRMVSTGSLDSNHANDSGEGSFPRAIRIHSSGSATSQPRPSRAVASVTPRHQDWAALRLANNHALRGGIFSPAPDEGPSQASLSSSSTGSFLPHSSSLRTAGGRRRLLHRNSLGSVLDEDPLLDDDSCYEVHDSEDILQVHKSHSGLPGMDTTQDTLNDTYDQSFSTFPNTPPRNLDSAHHQI